MKKIGFLPILALVLVSGLAFMSCWTTGSVDEPTQFEGRWLNLAIMDNSAYTDFSFTFIGNTFVFRQILNEGIVMDQTVSGTFKYSDTRIQFTTRTRTWTQRYTLIDNELSFIGNSSRFPLGTGVFTKQ